MNAIKKIKGAALQFAILISIVLTLLLSSFLVLTYTQRFFTIQHSFFTETVKQADTGIAFALEENNVFTDSVSMPFGDFGINTIKKSAFGGFLKIESQATLKSKVFTKIGLAGSITRIPKIALYTSNSEKSLKVAGATKILGDAYVSEKGIQIAAIKFDMGNGSNFNTERVKRAAPVLPKLDASWLHDIKLLINSGADESFIPISEVPETIRSFEDSSVSIYSRNSIKISETYIGNFIFKSASEIFVSKNAVLEDIQLIAPKITIEKGFSGTVHCIANQQILIENEVSLKYPSSATLIDANAATTSREPKIGIGENVFFSGNIIYLNTTPVLNNNSSVYIGDNTVVEGYVYCKGIAEMKQVTIKGAVYTHKFETSIAGTRYYNYIYNTQFLGTELHNSYCGLPFENSTKAIGKWLY